MEQFDIKHFNFDWFNRQIRVYLAKHNLIQYQTVFAKADGSDFMPINTFNTIDASSGRKTATIFAFYFFIKPLLTTNNIQAKELADNIPNNLNYFSIILKYGIQTEQFGVEVRVSDVSYKISQGILIKDKTVLDQLFNGEDGYAIKKAFQKISKEYMPANAKKQEKEFYQKVINCCNDPYAYVVTKAIKQ